MIVADLLDYYWITTFVNYYTDLVYGALMTFMFLLSWFASASIDAPVDKINNKRTLFYVELIVIFNEKCKCVYLRVTSLVIVVQCAPYQTVLQIGSAQSFAM